MLPAYWIVDEYLNDRQYETGFPTLADAVESLGGFVCRVTRKPFQPHPFLERGVPFPERSCVVTHGTVEFCRDTEKHYGRHWTPGLYFNNHVKYFYRYASHFGDDLLNNDFVIVPYGEFIRRLKTQDDDLFYESSYFVKPESGMKEFVGQVIYTESLDDDLNKLTAHRVVSPETLCVIAAPKSIKAEFRYIICEGKVIAQSEYRWDNVLDVRVDTHPTCDALAKKVAEANWQADQVYVCDIALTKNNQAKIIEFNAFSSSGLYACDTIAIVKAVSEAAYHEHSYD